MQEKTIENMIHVLKKIERNEYSQEEVVGIVPFTPIQLEFKKWNLKNENHFNQAIMLKTKKFDKEALKATLNELIRHHDILRAIFKNGNQEILPLKESKLSNLEVFDMTNISEDNLSEYVWRASTEIQKKINIEDGPLFKAALFETVDEEHLLLCIHHLVVDGVSWRIILEDFERGYFQYLNEKRITLPPKTASYKEWAEALQEYESSYDLKSQVDYWKNVQNQIDDGKLIGDLNESHIYKNVILEIDKETTEDLIKSSNEAYGTEINDLLLSALVIANNKLNGNNKLAVALEGHGREEIHKAIKIDRTVGWFTSIYPIILEYCNNVEQSIINTKEILRRVPNKGIGYGVLKNLGNGLIEDKVIDVCFNYLGDLDNLVNSNNNEDDKAIKSSNLPTGEAVSEVINSNNMSFNGRIKDKKLSFIITYNAGMYSEEFINKLIHEYKHAIKEIVLLCKNSKKKIKTPSDYYLFDMTYSELLQIESKYGEQNVESIYDLTPMQEGMLFHKLLDEKSTGYFVQEIVRFNGEINSERIKEAINLVAKKYDVLRTSIMYNNISKPRQVIIKNREIEVIEIALLNSDDESKEIEKICKNDINRGFDLENDSLLRVTIIKGNNNKNKLIMSFHHIIMDGWCISLILGAFANYYSMLSEGKSKEEIIALINKEIGECSSYGDYVRWLCKQNKDEALEYWKKLLDGYEEVSLINPLGIADESNEEIESLDINIDINTSNKIKDIAVKENVTINTVLESAWGILLQKYNNSSDIVFGKVVSGRNAEVKGIDKVIGLFINTIPLRIETSEDLSFTEVLHSVQEQAINGLKYDYCPLVEIQNQSSMGQELIKTLFVFENYFVDNNVNTSGLEGLEIGIEGGREQTNYPITITIKFSDVLNISIMYDPSLYSKLEIKNILIRMKKILNQVVECPNKKLKDIDILLEKEINIVEKYNNTKALFEYEKPIQQLLQDKANEISYKTAIICDDKEITYGELNSKANKLARVLRRKGVKPNDYVVVMAERSIEMIIGILGIVKSGGAYVPVDPNYPEERIKYIAEDCNAKFLLTNINEVSLNINKEIININDEIINLENDEDLDIVNSIEDLFYIIYTSGSTGNPKGVVIDQRGAWNTIIDINNKFNVNEKDNILGISSVCFDLSVYDIFGALTSGATLVINKDQRDIKEIERLIEKYDITIWNSVPAIMQLVVEDLRSEYRNNKLRTVLLSGDWIPLDLNGKIITKFVNAKVISLGGATEASIWSIYYPIKQIQDSWKSVPYGYPLANQTIYILDKNMNICPIGTKGEIYIGGIGVAKGYINDSEKNKKHFINHSKYGFLYRTGDYGVFNINGYVEFIGRIDFQVKVNGFRIELGEIESAIRKQDNIKNTAVIISENQYGNKNICAYIVGDKEINVELLKEKLMSVLPQYMVPTYIVQIEEIPLTKNGKLDRKSLPKIEIINDNEYVAPRDEIEEKIVKAFENVLGVEKIGVNSNFFQLGGDSIKAIRLVSKIREAGYEITVKDLMEAKTIAKIKERVLEIAEENKYSQEDVVGFVELTPIQKEFKNWKLKKENHFNQAQMIMCKEFNKEALIKALEKVIIHHDILRARFIDGKQEILEVSKSKLFDMETFDFSNLKDDELVNTVWEECSRIQESINLETGPLVKTALIKTKEEEHFMICIHHLVVDAVSWRIILEDFTSAYNQYIKDKQINLPLKTASYMEWSNALKEYENSKEVAKEEEYWININNSIEEGLVLSNKSKSNEYKNIVFEIDEQYTNELISNISTIYGTEINDVLLTALGMALKKCTGQSKIAVKMEGHGRESIHKPICIDRTVGWFTSMYPIIIETNEDVENNLISVKEMLRKVPNKGFGYNILKYKENSKLKSSSKIDICFNYLGDMTNMVNDRTKDSEGINMSYLPTGRAIDSEINENSIIINGSLAFNKINFSISYDTGKYDEIFIEKLTTSYIKSIEEIISLVQDKDENEVIKTASDFGLSDYSDDDIEDLDDFINSILE
ncbi:MAG: amino acid adenylation domain-containing protein [Clostridium sp.]